MKTILARDEREESIDRAGDRLAYLVISFGLLALVAYNAFALDRQSWELLGLVIIGGLVGAAYRLVHRAMSRQAWLAIGITMAAAAVVAVAVAVAIR